MSITDLIRKKKAEQIEPRNEAIKVAWAETTN